MRQLVLLSLALTVIATASATTAGDCVGPFKDYLNCIAADTGDSVKGRALEQEFDDDFDKHCADCYNQDSSSSNSNKCILSKANLETDICGDDGPLHGCAKCQDYCNEIRKRIFDASPSVKACFREKFSDAVVNDLQPCIREQLKDQTFSIPKLPDFDKSTELWKDLVKRGIDHRVMAYSRLGVCKEQHPERAAVTGPCMDNNRGLYPLHCSLSKKCSNSVTGNCKEVFQKTKTATCKCMVIKRDEWHDRLDKVKDAVFNPQHSSTVCASGVKQALGHWISDFQSIADACLPKDGGSGKIPNLPLDKLIDAACIQAVEAASDGGKSAQLLSGFRAVRNILDAFNDRITSFCDVDCF